MNQSEIWQICLDLTIGAEIKKTRPGLIISSSALGKLPLKIIVPLTEWKEQYDAYPWMVKIIPSRQNGLTKPSAIDCFQIRSVSIDRFINYIGSVETDTIAQVQEAISQVIGVH
jgi:mRNA interferase MazF